MFAPDDEKDWIPKEVWSHITEIIQVLLRVPMSDTIEFCKLADMKRLRQCLQTDGTTQTPALGDGRLDVMTHVN